MLVDGEQIHVMLALSSRVFHCIPQPHHVLFDVTVDQILASAHLPGHLEHVLANGGGVVGRGQRAEHVLCRPGQKHDGGGVKSRQIKHARGFQVADGDVQFAQAHGTTPWEGRSS